MTSGQRIAILAVGLVVLVGAFVLFQGSDDEGGAEQTRTPAETVAGGSEPAPTTATNGDTTAETAPAPAPEPEPRVETVRIRAGQAVGEPRTLRFEDGDTIRLRFRSDAASEVHIHGYDRYVNIPAGGSETARFEADAQGVFEIEDHGTGALLARLEVRP